jgi:CheY-like chemotaxis protein
MNTIPLEILLAEDDEGHAYLVQTNLKRAGIANEIIHVKDGQEALDFIFRRGQFADRGRGKSLLVILDINMPRIDGIEVLTHIKNSPATTTLPVIMLTTTDDPREVERCYQIGCNVYITKPVAYDDFVDAVKRLGLLLQVVQLPIEEPKPGATT